MFMIGVLLPYSDSALKAEEFQNLTFQLAYLKKFWPPLCQKYKRFMISKVVQVELISLYSAIKYEVEIYNQRLHSTFNWSCPALSYNHMIFENLHLSVYCFISTVKRFMEPVCCHKLKRKILLEMVKTIVQASLCGEGIVKTWKYYSYSIPIPPQTLLLKAFLWLSLIHLKSGLKKALLTSSQRATVEELFLDR